MINPKHVRRLVIEQALKELKLESRVATELLMLTAAVESNFGTYLKQGVDSVADAQGVGLGMFSIEPETFQYLKDRYQGKFYPQLNVEPWDLITDLKLGAKFARLKYLSIKDPLPKDPTDYLELAVYWKKFYNGSKYGLTPSGAVIKYKMLMAEGGGWERD